MLGLLANIPRLHALRTMRELRYSDVRLSANQWYDLMFDATGSADQAEEAFKKVRHAELRAGITPQ